MDSKLIPYSVYLPKELHQKLKQLAVNRKASELIRNAIQLIIDGHKEYDSGYNQGLKDAIKVIILNENAMNVAISKSIIGIQLISEIESLEKL